jgi:hypothetical protein
MPNQASNARSAPVDGIFAGRDAPAVAASTPLLCEKTFADFCKSSSRNEIHEAVLLGLVEGDIRLLRIANARAQKDWAAAAREANALAHTAATLGLMQASGLARQLEDACLSGGHGTTYRLIGQLSEVFQISGETLDVLLRRGTPLS